MSIRALRKPRRLQHFNHWPPCWDTIQICACNTERAEESCFVGLCTKDIMLLFVPVICNRSCIMQGVDGPNVGREWRTPGIETKNRRTAIIWLTLQSHSEFNCALNSSARNWYDALFDTWFGAISVVWLSNRKYRRVLAQARRFWFFRCSFRPLSSLILMPINWNDYSTDILYTERALVVNVVSIRRQLSKS